MHVGRGLAASACQPPVPSPQPRSLSPWGERRDYRGYQGNIHDERYASLGRRDAGSTLDPTLNRMYESRLHRWRCTAATPCSAHVRGADVLG